MYIFLSQISYIYAQFNLEETFAYIVKIHIYIEASGLS